jgi:tetratricopeptide (TPR) repeat protein
MKPTSAPRKNPELYQQTEEAIELAKRGQKARALPLLRDVVTRDASYELAWWWIAQTTEDVKEQWLALDKVIMLNPEHVEAESRRLRLQQKIWRDLADPRRAGGLNWKEILPNVPLEPPDSIDDPYQCPYCGRPTDEADKRCRSCKGALYVQTRRALSTGLMPLATLLLGLLGVICAAQAAPALLVLAMQNNVAGNLSLLNNRPGVEWVLGDFMHLTATHINIVLGTAGARTLIYWALIFALRAKWNWAFYTAVALVLLECLFIMALMAFGWVGPVLGLLDLGLAIGAAFALFGLSYEFMTSETRILVRPDGAAKSAADYDKRGHTYSERGMWALAVAQWRKAVGLAPAQTTYYKNLGLAYARIRRFDRSARVLEEAHHQAPDNAEIAKLLTLIREQLAAQNKAAPR